MPTERKRVALLPDVEALAIAGYDITPDDEGRWNEPTTAINGACRRYAMLVEQAGRELASVLSRAEWNAIADVMNGSADLMDYSETPMVALQMIVPNLQDGDALEGTGKKWKIDVADVVRRLQSLTPAHGEAILAAVRWFWSHSAAIYHSKHQWWHPEFRRKAIRATNAE